jgi:hypothetical protein
MDFSQQKRPDIKHVFLSTETNSVIEELKKFNYTHIKLYSIDYKRIEETTSSPLLNTNASNKFVASFAKLMIAVQADIL